MSRRRRRHSKWKENGMIRKGEPGSTILPASGPSGPKPAQQTTTTTTKTYSRYCRHWRDKFDLMDGLVIYASAWSDRPLNANQQVLWGNDVRPDMGFYLDEMWGSQGVMVSPDFPPAPWVGATDDYPRLLYPWVDHAAPGDLDHFHLACEWVLTELRNGKVIDIGCWGGHGRTGTMLACLLVIQGLDADTAMKQVNDRYCVQAIESFSQETFAARLEYKLRGSTESPMDEWNPRESTPFAPGTTRTVEPGSGCDADDIYWDRLHENSYSHEGATEYERFIRALEYEDWEDEVRRPYSDDGPVWLTSEEREREELRTENDMLCYSPPCRYPLDCHAAEGECHSRLACAAGDVVTRVELATKTVKERESD